MATKRIQAAAVLVCVLFAALGGCETIRGDREVDTAPQGDDVGKRPGLFTGKKGALIIETEPWQGPSPYGDSEE